ncbi:16S rRNA (cytosine(1402)-N(4))-methyltransferase RsmH [Candidatus Electronema sp. JC]|uniref:16S rRNA (cytosine(1402)-N(4))-methyltransferase RsmH n=1 Tax=Candidatus Electronema sp. JC TaxID=3401570 RepID=UPI003AA8C754
MTAQKDDTARHVPVLPREVLDWLRPCSGGSYADGTLGLGGHAELILRQSGPDGRLFGFEWDSQAAARAQERLAEFGGRFQLIPSSYAEMAARIRAQETGPLDGILLDLGVSSLQFDSPERGFSFQSDAPLDMRMSRSLPVTAAELLNNLNQDELADIFFHYGEERQARRIARFIAEARLVQPVTTTRQLAEIVRQAVPVKYQPKKIHPATLVFQALRIAVNRELDNLAQALADAPQLLASGGRLCVITFHSLEDRMVKQSFAANPALRVLTKKPVPPGAEEIAANPRSRSAKLRVAEKI